MTRPFFLLLILLFHPCQAASAEPLGRLFFSPAERVALDQARDRKSGGPVAETHGQVSLSGYVKRSSGKSTAWINSVPQHEDGGTKPSANGVPVRLPSGRQVILKPGQSYDPVRGEIRESYQAAPASLQDK